MPLKYLFTACYSDSTQYKQTPEDISIKEAGKSCYYDIDHSKLVKFELTDGIHTHSVDLTDGSFNINGVKIDINKPDTPIGGNFRLIYYRKNIIIFGQGLADVIYYIGWQTTLSGENIKNIIEFR
jgi:hypothetical protein